MSEEFEVLKIVTGRLNEAGIPYMISGSVAANYYTIPRMTRDIDLVIELRLDNIEEFVGLFQADFYLDKETVAREVSRQGMFNLIHNQYVVKIDFIVKGSTPYQQAAFSHRKEVLIEQHSIWFISAEDLILSKLLWAKDSHSEMQLRDVANLAGTVGGIDTGYINRWVRELGIEQIYKEANNE